MVMTASKARGKKTVIRTISGEKKRISRRGKSGKTCLEIPPFSLPRHINNGPTVATEGGGGGGKINSPPFVVECVCVSVYLLNVCRQRHSQWGGKTPPKASSSASKWGFVRTRSLSDITNRHRPKRGIRKKGGVATKPTSIGRCVVCVVDSVVAIKAHLDLFYPRQNHNWQLWEEKKKRLTDKSKLISRQSVYIHF